MVNVSSAAQDTVNGRDLESTQALSDMDAYSKSKLAIIMWSRHLARELNGNPSFIAVNPGSLLGTKMVKEAFGMDGKSVTIGADILQKAATDKAFANANGCYFDNDSGSFSDPHPHALNDAACTELTATVDALLERIL